LVFDYSISLIISFFIAGFHHSNQLKKLVERLRPKLVFVAHEAFKSLQVTSNKEEYVLMHYVHNPYEFVPDPAPSPLGRVVFHIL
jgi:hypothetical protein